MTAEDRAAHVEREAVARAIADWLDRDDVSENRAADEVRARAAEVAAVLAALPQTGDAAAVVAALNECIARSEAVTPRENLRGNERRTYWQGAADVLAVVRGQRDSLLRGADQ